MTFQQFDTYAWRSTCHNLEVSCSDRALSPMHALFLFSQAIDDALQELPFDQVGVAFDIAREFGYESSLERAEFIQWFKTDLSRRNQALAGYR